MCQLSSSSGRPTRDTIEPEILHPGTALALGDTLLGNRIGLPALLRLARSVSSRITGSRSSPLPP